MALCTYKSIKHKSFGSPIKDNNLVTLTLLPEFSFLKYVEDFFFYILIIYYYNVSKFSFILVISGMFVYRVTGSQVSMPTTLHTEVHTVTWLRTQLYFTGQLQ